MNQAIGPQKDEGEMEQTNRWEAWNQLESILEKFKLGRGLDE